MRAAARTTGSDQKTRLSSQLPGTAANAWALRLVAMDRWQHRRHRQQRQPEVDPGQPEQPQTQPATPGQERAAPIASSEAGFSSDERSPGSSPRYTALTTRRRILALRVRGRSGTKYTAFGRIGLPIAEAIRSRSSSASRWLGSLPLRSTTKQMSDSPLISSGTPTAADSATAACRVRTDSTSAGPSRLPATLMVSSE